MSPSTGRIDEFTHVSHLGNLIRQHTGRIVLLLLAISLSAPAAETLAPLVEATKPGLENLTLANFLSTGWNEPWTRRPRGNGTPNMSLLRVQTNFLAQLFRTDYAAQENLADTSARGSDSLSGTLEYAFNRRLMLALIGNYRWIDSRKAEDTEGVAGAAFARLQWLDTATSSLATTLRVGMPNHNLGEKDTTLSLAVAGWQDLALLGLNRVGLYYHLQEEALVGPGKSGNRRNDLTYAISLAKTWSNPDSLLGNATTFVEGYGKTDLDGADRGHTVITVTPGIRATLAHRHILMAGIEFPVTDPRPFERIIRLTYIYNF